jgi:nucleotide-binding universal stress UspA family protein
MYENVLIPTDGSDAATKATAHGFGLARWHNATVHLLYVVEEPPPDMMDEAGVFGEAGVTTYPEDLNPVLEEMGSEAVEDFATLAEELNVEAATEVLSGQPDEAILRFADERDVDLIVVGTRERSSVDRLLHRSVTDRVLRSTTVPVLVVHTTGDDLDP